MSTTGMLAMACGGLAGLGLALVLTGLLPAVPALGPALLRLHGQPDQTMAGGPASAGPVGRWLVGAVGPWLRPPHTRLRLIGQSTERYVLEKVGYTLLGLAFPAGFGTMLAAFGLRLGMVVPALGSLGLAVLLFVLVDVSVRQRATAAREEFRRAVAVYLDLVALERSAAHGPVEALERAARVGHGWVFDRLRDALAAARVASQPPWDALAGVADDIGVPELRDVGDIMRLSGTEGAQVYQTLVSRAQSLRVALRTSEQNRANTETTWLYVPVSLTVSVLFVLAGYPALIRLIST